MHPALAIIFPYATNAIGVIVLSIKYIKRNNQEMLLDPAISFPTRRRFNGPYFLDMVYLKPTRPLELHYPMMQFLITEKNRCLINIYYTGKGENKVKLQVIHTGAIP